jgi:hypothetical protein
LQVGYCKIFVAVEVGLRAKGNTARAVNAGLIKEQLTANI